MSRYPKPDNYPLSTNPNVRFPRFQRDKANESRQTRIALNALGHKGIGLTAPRQWLGEDDLGRLKAATPKPYQGQTYDLMGAWDGDWHYAKIEGPVTLETYIPLSGRTVNLGMTAIWHDMQWDFQGSNTFPTEVVLSVQDAGTDNAARETAALMFDISSPWNERDAGLQRLVINTANNYAEAPVWREPEFGNPANPAADFCLSSIIAVTEALNQGTATWQVSETAA